VLRTGKAGATGVGSGRVDPGKAVHACWPYMAALLVAAIIVAAVPWLALPGF